MKQCFYVAMMVDSVAKTKDAGYKPYMAPERIDPTGNPDNYVVRSDVWSFGIGMIKITKGKFPYELWALPFEQRAARIFGNYIFCLLFD